MNVYVPDWKGTCPYFLVIREYKKDRTNHSTVVDLDEPGWFVTHRSLMRKPGIWMLCSKALSEQQGEIWPLLIVKVEKGEQPYHVRKHVGILSMGSAESVEMVVHGLGKKRVDKTTDRLWLFENGMVAAGEDVYSIADMMNKGYL